MALASLLVQPDPEPVPLHKHVLDLHPESGTNPRKRIDHEVSGRGRASYGRAGVDSVQQLPGFSGVSTGVLPRRTICFGPRTAWAGFTGTTWPVTSQSNIIRMAESRCLAVGAAFVRVRCST